MSRSTTHKISPMELIIIGRDTEGDEDHFLYQDRAKLNPTPEEVEAAKSGIPGVVEVARLSGYDGYVVVAGRQRTIAAREAGLPEVECKVVKGTPVELTSRMVKENALQKAMTPLDKAKDAAKLLALHQEAGLTLKEARVATAQAFGQSEQSIKNYLQILDMDPKVHKAIETGKISADRALTALRKVDPEEQAEKLQEVLEQAKAPKRRADGRPAPERKRNMDKAILRYMANDEQSPLIPNEGEEDDPATKGARLALEICHGLCTKAEIFREVPNFKSAYERAKRALEKE